ncbi:condensation domain-containing protein [Kineosporia corallincola]|nr:condensation domain-containing protein [Kineosporia corallincola]
MEHVRPVTPLQEGLLFQVLARRERADVPDVHVAQLALDLRGAVDPGRWRAAAQALLDRHPALRVGFRQETTGRSVAVAGEHVVLPWQEIDLGHLSAQGYGRAALDRELAAQTETDLLRGFDPAVAPLLRATLYRLGPEWYRLVLTHHRLVLGAASMRALLDELLASAGAAVPVPEGWTCVGDPVPEDRTGLAGGVFGDDPEPGFPAYSGAGTLIASGAGHDPAQLPERLGEELDPATTAALAALAHEELVTPEAVVRAAWGIVLSALTGTPDVVFGTMATVRPERTGQDRRDGRAETDACARVGQFGVVVPVRLRVDPARPTGDLLREAGGAGGAAEPGAVPPMDQLFDTMVVFAGHPVNAGLPRWVDDVEVADAAVRDFSPCPLTLIATDSERLRLELVFAPGAVDAVLAGRVLARFTGVLRQLAHASIPSAGRLDLLLEGERVELLGPRTLGENPRNVPSSIIDVLREQARRHPDAVALVTEQQRWTYAELDDWSGRVAAGLCNLPDWDGHIVGLQLPRAWMLPAALAVLRSGAAALLLDEAAPAERSYAMLADASPTVVVRSVEELENAWFAASSELPAIIPGSPALVVYTSGSTGEPQGVVVTQMALANLLASHRRHLMVRYGTRLRLGQVQPFTSDAFWDQVLWMLAGHQLHVIADDVHRDPETLITYLDRHGIDGIDLTPTHLRELIPAGLLDANAGRLKLLTVGGEPLDPALWRRICGEPGLRVHDLYGAVETTVDAWGRLSGPSGRRSAYRVDGVRTYLLDAALRPVPAGVVGELYVAGAGLALGYLDRPAQTAARFVADPFRPGERMYRTGDLARRGADGVLEFAGRTDRQLKIHGHRVEPGEIEAALCSLPGVAQAAVVLREGTLTGYLVRRGSGLFNGPKQPGRPGEGGTPAELPREETAGLRERLERVLPGHLVPERFVRLAALPRTPGGKLDVAALPSPPSSQPPAVPPRTEREALLAGVFAEMLGLERVGIHDDFLALGGHPLLVLRLAGRLSVGLGLKVGVRDILDAPTVERLARRLPYGDRPRLRAGSAPNSPEQTELSPAQRRPWSDYRRSGPDGGANVAIAWRLIGPLDVAALGAAVADLARRHDPLRSVVTEHDGVPHLTVRDEVPALRVIEAGGAGRPRPAQRLAAEARYAFRPDREIPLRVTLFRVAEDEHLLLLLAHRIAADECSDVPLLTDLSRAYAARTRGEEPRFAPLPVRYADYSRWQNDLLGDPADPASPAARQRNYWSRRLAGLPDEMTLPADHQGPVTGAGGAESFAIGAAAAGRLRGVAAAHDVPVSLLFQAAVAVLLTKLGAGNDIPLVSPVSGRRDPALEGLVGCFGNAVVLRADTSGDPLLPELLARLRDTALAAADRQDLPFDGPAQVMVTYRAQVRRALDLPGLGCLPVRVERATPRADLCFGVADLGPAGMEGLIDYSADRFDPLTVAALGSRLVRVLEQMAAAPGARLSSYHALLPGERERVTGRWATGGPVSIDMMGLSVVDVVAQQARLTPHATALVTAAGRWSFAELEAWTNRAARVLLWAGPLRGRLVALHLDRAWMLPAILAVLKTGAAYLSPEPGQVPPAGAEPVLTLDSAALLDGGESDAPLTDAERGGPLVPDLPAWVSGTGVVVTHSALVNLATSHHARLMGPDSSRCRVAHTASFAHARSWEPVLWMLAGHELHVIPDGPGLVARLRDARIEVLEVTPAQLVRLLPVGLLGIGLSVLLIGDGPVDHDVWQGVCAVPGLVVHQLYGSAETSVDAYGWHGYANGGRAAYRLDGVCTYVLDASLHPVPVGVTGDLYVAGAGLAYGYLGRPGRTASCFVADPFRPGQRMYRTGDLARWTTDGMLTLVRRRDRPPVTPLTPAALRLLGTGGPIGGFSGSEVVQLPAGVDPDRLQAALRAVVAAHPALRTRLTGDGLEQPDRWQAPLIRTVPARDQDPQELWRSISRQAGLERARLDPREGVMLTAVRFDRGPDHSGRLLIVANQLVVDSVSWHVLLSDLSLAYSQTLCGNINLVPEGTSFRHWARRLTGLAQARGPEMRQWCKILTAAPRLPVDRDVDPVLDRTTSLQEVGRELPVARTDQILHAAPLAFGVPVCEVLLTALALAVGDLRRRHQDRGAGQGHGGDARDEGSAGPSSSLRGSARLRGVLVSLTADGRSTETADTAGTANGTNAAGTFDISRTVGCFTHTYPAHLDPGDVDLDDALAGGPAAAQAVTNVAKALAEIPDGGLGYGLLREVNRCTAGELARHPEPQIGFFWAGRTDFPAPADWSPAPESEAAGAESPVTQALVVTARVEERPTGPQLTVSWVWPEGVLDASTVEDLADTWLRALTAIGRCAARQQTPGPAQEQT